MRCTGKGRDVQQVSAEEQREEAGQDLEGEAHRKEDQARRQTVVDTADRPLKNVQSLGMQPAGRSRSRRLEASCPSSLRAIHDLAPPRAAAGAPAGRRAAALHAGPSRPIAITILDRPAATAVARERSQSVAQPTARRRPAAPAAATPWWPSGSGRRTRA